MNYIGKVLSNFKDVYNEINGATLTGAIDAVVVHQEDGSYISSPFHVRFGKIGVLRSREKVVDIEINGNPVDIRMKLGETGEAFFVEEIGEGDEVSSLLGTSPLPSSFFDEYKRGHSVKEDDVRSQDSGVEAEEISNSKCDLPDGHTVPIATSQGPDATTTDPVVAIPENFVVEDPSKRNASIKVPVSASVEVLHSWHQEALVRSRSLTTETELLQALLEGQGSKTDGEDIIGTKLSSRNTRRRRKKRALSRKSRIMMIESQSSDNSTTSETADLSSLVVTGSATHNTDTMFVMDDFENGLVNHPNTFSDNSLSNTLPKVKSKTWMGHRTLGPDFHPFSDTDISPPPSPNNSRPQTPVKSDTEYEYEKQKLVGAADVHGDNKWSWTWGELPTPPQSSRSNSISVTGFHNSAPSNKTISKDQISTQADKDAQRSMLGNMFSFMRATKKARHNPEGGDIYLDDLSKLDEIDPEVAALYFPTNSILYKDTGFRTVTKDEDAESGNGTSLPQSPNSVEGAIGGLKISDSDCEDIACRHHHISSYKEDLAFSMCGALHDHLEGSFPESLFLQSLVTYDDFCAKPDLLYNPNLVVRLGGKYTNWATAAPQVMSIVLFQRPLPAKVVESLEAENLPKKEMRKRTASKSYSWFSWGRNSTALKGEEMKNVDESVAASDPATEALSIEAASLSLAITYPVAVLDGVDSCPVVAKEDTSHEERNVNVEDHVKEKDVKKRVRNDSSGSEEADDEKNPGRYKKSLRLSSEQIKKLNLRSGSNEVVFSVTTAYQGTTRCMCHIFLWNYDENIIISDIDGTITKSDVLGQILPIIGKDWAQGGVAQLFTKIKNNGYNFLYLSARAIGQARITRDYLRSVKQGDVSLPDGPLLLNPTSLIQAFHREVIERKPEEFKISCLRDIKALFPSGRNPFYAGYGNKINDVYSYRAVGIPISRIFTINHRGELKHELTQAFQTTYSSLTDIAHHMFPPANHNDFFGEFSSLQYWRCPLPDLTQEIEMQLAKAKIK